MLLIFGAIMFSSISFASIGYEALVATFPILVNGEKISTDKPAVVIDGSTYLPLKALGQALNVDYLN